MPPLDERSPEGTHATRFEAVWLTSHFIRALDRLCRGEPRVRAKVERVLDAYLGGTKPLQRSPLVNARRALYHTRVDDEKRLIDEPLRDELAGEVAVLHVGHHDDANA
jgi:hypothetical protein